MALIHRQDDNGNQQPPQDGGGDQSAGSGGGGGGGDTQPSDGGQSQAGQASLPFVDPASSTAPVTPTTRALAASGDTTTGFIPVGSGVAQNPSGESLVSATGLSGTLTVNVSTGTAELAPGASITSSQSSAQQATALGLSLPVLIGIIAGVFAFLLIVLIIVIILYRRAGRKRRAQNSLHSHDTEGLPYAGGGGRSRHKDDELTPPPTPAPLSHKAMMQEKQRDLAALDALVSALDQAQSRSGAQRYDPSRSGPGAGSVAKLKAATAVAGTRQSDFLEWDDEDETSEFDAKRQKRRTVDELPDADVFRAAIAPKKSY